MRGTIGKHRKAIGDDYMCWSITICYTKYVYYILSATACQPFCGLSFRSVAGIDTVRFGIGGGYEQQRCEARCGPVWALLGGDRVRTALRAAAGVFRELWERSIIVTL